LETFVGGHLGGAVLERHKRNALDVRDQLGRAILKGYKRNADIDQRNDATQLCNNVGGSLVWRRRQIGRITKDRCPDAGCARADSWCRQCMALADSRHANRRRVGRAAGSS
jgi:hypothetical protein